MGEILGRQPNWISLRLLRLSEGRCLLRRVRPDLYILHGLTATIGLAGTQLHRQLMRAMDRRIAKMISEEVDRFMNRRADIFKVIQKVHEEADFEGLGRATSERDEGIRKTLERLVWFRLIGRRRGSRVLCEQDSFWHKLIWCGNREIFSLLPRPAAVVVILSPDLGEVLLRRNTGNSGYDRKRFDGMGSKRQYDVIRREQQLWVNFAEACENLELPLLRLQAYGYSAMIN